MTKKRVWVIRHAQSLYNSAVRQWQTWLTPSFWLNGFDPMIRDPDISALGAAQCDQLRDRLQKESFLKNNKIDLIVSSPLRRALQTTTRVFPEILEQDNKDPADAPPPVVVSHLHREFNVSLVGSESPKLEQEFPHLNFEHLPPVWWFHDSVDRDVGIREPGWSKEKRVEEFRAWLRERPEKNIVVVGHSKFFMSLTGQPKLGNCEVEVFELDCH